MTTVYLIRHGQTASNGQCYAGRLDVPLTAEGRAQAKHIAHTLASVRIDLILSSPLQRAMDTAKPLSQETQCAIRTMPDLMEFDFGVLEGRPKADVALSLRQSHMTQPVPGGEALADIWLRTRRVAEAVFALSTSSTIALVGHYWTNRMLHAHLTHQPLQEATSSQSYRPKTGSVFRLTCDGGQERDLRAGVQNMSGQ